MSDVHTPPQTGKSTPHGLAPAPVARPRTSRYGPPGQECGATGIRGGSRLAGEVDGVCSTSDGRMAVPTIDTT